MRRPQAPWDGWHSFRAPPGRKWCVCEGLKLWQAVRLASASPLPWGAPSSRAAPLEEPGTEQVSSLRVCWKVQDCFGATEGVKAGTWLRDVATSSSAALGE